MSRLFGQGHGVLHRSVFLITTTLSLMPGVSCAALGDHLADMPSGAVSILSGAAYESSFTDAAGTTIREYLSDSGDVFAYTWSGPGSPNIHQLLGSRFAAYRAASRQPQPDTGLVSLHAGSVATSDAVVEAGGAMRAYHGRAWLPGLLPAGISISELQ